MCTQISDSVDLEGEACRLVGYFHRDDDADLFHPQQIGIRPVGITTACHRGFHCGYAVADGRLVLRRLSVGLHREHHEAARAGLGPRRFGRLPESDPRDPPGSMGFWSWENLAEPLNFTGKLVVGLEFPDVTEPDGTFLCWRDPIGAPALYELYFDRDELIARVDLTAAAAALCPRLQEAAETDLGGDHWAGLTWMAEGLFDRRLRRSEWDYARPDAEPLWWDEEPLQGGRDLS